MAYAELAGVPAHHGLYASALPCLLAAFFASSPYLQTGPVATTSLLTLGALVTLVDPSDPTFVAYAALLAVLVGALRLLFGVLRLGTIAYLMSQPVLRGFILAAAFLIMLSQVHYVLGVVPPGGLGVGPRAFWAIAHPEGWDVASIVLSVVGIAIIQGGRRLHALFPGVLVAVIVGLVFSAVTGYADAEPLRIVGDVPQVLFPPLTFDLPWDRTLTLVPSALVIAVVGFAEAASISQTFAEAERIPWDPNREFISQGVANLAAGFTGGLPVGGSFSRSAIGHMAGAQTRWSGGITGLVVLLVIPFAGVLSALPKAILGAIVLAGVIKLLNPWPVLVFFKQSVPQALIGVTTFAATLLLAPHVEYAVLLGAVLALAVHAYREQQVLVDVEQDGEVLVLKLQGVLWYGSAPLVRERMTRELAAHPAARTVHLDLSAVGRVDLTAALVLAEVLDVANRSPLVEANVIGVPKHAESILANVLPEAAYDASPVEA
jgi:SulP family sulfate permease